MRKLQTVTIICGISFLLLAGCGKTVEFKSPEDRQTVTPEEMSAIEKTVKKMDGVAHFNMDYDETGIYSELSVKDKKQAKDLSKKVFNLIWAETSDSITLFVTKKGDKNNVLIEAFKPVGSDEKNEWDIFL